MPVTQPRRISLPLHRETITCPENHPGAEIVTFPDGTLYFCCPVQSPDQPNRLDGAPRWKRTDYDVYPIIVRSSGDPWYEANLWIRHILQEKGHNPLASTRTLTSTVDDLVAYLRFIEEEEVDWLDFSSQFKADRPTYRYQTYLESESLKKKSGKEISWAVKDRRIKTVIRFYRWLESEAGFKPKRPTWSERKITLRVPTAHGFSVDISVTTTDLTPKGKSKPNPFEAWIEDGGKMRPLTEEQQGWLEEALQEHGNFEIQLMHWLAWHTGARLQTVLTFRRKHFWRDATTMGFNSDPRAKNRFMAIPVGPGTGIDTKYGQKYLLHVPAWLYQELHMYVHGERATLRRRKAAGGDIDDQYLFLTEKTKQPWYRSMQAVPALNEGHRQRRHRTGDALGSIIRNEIVPLIRAKHDAHFEYTFHWMRATFGMNELERLLDKPKDSKKPDGPKWTLIDALKWVQSRLHHTSITTTEGYLHYREQVQKIRTAQDEWETELVARQKRHASSHRGTLMDDMEQAN